MSELFVGKFLFRELSQDVEAEFLVRRFPLGGVYLSIYGGGDLEVHFDSEKTAELLDLLSNALRISETQGNEWMNVGSVPYTGCTLDDPQHEDNRGHVVVDAGARKVRLTVHSDPRSDWFDWPVVMEGTPIRQLISLIREAVNSPYGGVSQDPRFQ